MPYKKLIMPSNRICVSISDDDLEFIKKIGDSPSVLLRKKIQEERKKNQDTFKEEMIKHGI